MKKILVAILLVALALLTVTSCGKKVNYTVTFDTDGGSAVEAQTVEEGATATAPEAPTKEGYTFAGWYVGEAAYDFGTPVTADVTVKAAWTLNSYTVTFDSDGGSAVDAQTVAHGAIATLPEAPTK
ncbi:MAG: InlB B-repeat-containing protein, partial [Clostridia bacterium]|nr:InlB B-repeat-containing protein [Clostridia bacterium]